MHLFPTKRQWKNWSLPSKLTAIGALIGCISLLIYIGEIVCSSLNINENLRSGSIEKKGTEAAETRVLASKQSQLQLLDVAFVDDPNFPTIEVKVKNSGEGIAYVTAATFHVKKTWGIIPPSFFSGHVPLSATYDVRLPAQGAPYSKEIKVSQAVPPNGVDRFAFKLLTDGDCIYLFNLGITYDALDHSLDSKDILVFRKKPTSIYSDPDFAQSDAVIGARGAEFIAHNQAVMNEILELGVLKHPALLELERHVAKTVPLLKRRLSIYEDRLIAVSDGSTTALSHIQQLNDPRIGIVLEGQKMTCTHINDSQLAMLSRLTKLEELDLNHREITDDGVRHLAGLKELRFLGLGWSKVSDASMAIVRNFRKLQELDLRGTDIGNDGISYFTGHTNLQILWLWDTKVTDAGLQHIGKIPNLTSLHFLRVNIGDNGLKYLSTLENLRRLDLRDTLVTDACLVYLKPLRNLVELSLGGADVSKAGIKAIEENIPGLKVVY